MTRLIFSVLLLPAIALLIAAFLAASFGGRVRASGSNSHEKPRGGPLSH